MPWIAAHGKETRYRKYGCRCETCVAGAKARNRLRCRRRPTGDTTRQLSFSRRPDIDPVVVDRAKRGDKIVTTLYERRQAVIELTIAWCDHCGRRGCAASHISELLGLSQRSVVRHRQAAGIHPPDWTPREAAA